mgnify:CR=1 FL=1
MPVSDRPRRYKGETDRVVTVIPLEWVKEIDKERGPFETRSVWLKTLIYNHLLKSGKIDPI